MRRSLKRLLENVGHEVVIEAQTLKAALSSIQLAKDLGVQVAIVDGNLNSWDILVVMTVGFYLLR